MVTLRLIRSVLLLLIYYSVGLCTARAEAERPTQEARIENLGDGRVKVGQIVLDRAARTATLPAKVNMDTGYLEYLLVTERGKTHESLLSTTAQPVNLHTAMLLLGVRGSPASRVEGTGDAAKPTCIGAECRKTAKSPEGDPVTIALTWKGEDGTLRSAPLEDWVIYEKRNSPAERGPWIYNGSEIYRGNFVAQGDGSFVAVVADSFALINNPRAGNKDDQAWKPNTAAMPPVDTPVTVIISTRNEAKSGSFKTPKSKPKDH